MKRKDIEQLASKNDTEITICKISESTNDSITFVVDEGLSAPQYHLNKMGGIDIAKYCVSKEQIDEQLIDIVGCSFENDKFSYLDRDTLYRCFITCYAEHRPLVLTPDTIWLVIVQSLTEHLHNNAETYREKLVYHKGKMDIEIESSYDICDKRCNWKNIFDGFYDKIAQNTNNGITKKILADFSTTGLDERICSIVTLMRGVESYFKYCVFHRKCGIPFITLKGNVQDWNLLLEKASVLNEYGLTNWYKWLKPILKEFIRAASGKPHLEFWKNIVQMAREEDFSEGRGCVRDYHYVDGWCVALFKHTDAKTGKPSYSRCLNVKSMTSEIIRVGFKYKLILPDGSEVITPMELWAGIVGVKEDRKTYALTPKIGWFVRKSHEEESLERLKSANNYRGIDITIDEVPEILGDIDTFDSLTLRFNDRIKLPDWLYNKNIKKLYLFGKIDKEYHKQIKKSFKKVYINKP